MSINYGTYENFESISTSIDTYNIIDKTNYKINVFRDGSSPNLALMSSQQLYYTNADGSGKKFNNGYYWINIPVVGPKYIFCRTDPDFFGGGWMLAMRSLFTSKTFNYASKHWTYNSTLNASSTEIKQLLPTLLGVRDKIITPLRQFDVDDINNSYKNKFDISSVGTNLYLDNDFMPNEIDINNFDCKLDTYNYFRANEIMIVFYILDNEKFNDPAIPKFSDGEKPNKIGWVWVEKIYPINYNNISNRIQPTLLELFQYLDMSETKSLKASNNPTMEIAKFKGSQSTSPFWYSTMPDINGNAFYGFNYKIKNMGARFGFSFGTEKELTSINGIGLSYEDSNIDYSAGRAINISAKTDNNSASLRDTIQFPNAKNYSTPISFEIYVR